MRKHKVGDHVLVKLSGGRIVEATIKAIVERQMVIGTFVTIFYAGWLLRKDYRRPADLFPLEVEVTSTRSAILTSGIPLFIP